MRRSASGKPGRRGIVIAALLALGVQLFAFWLVCSLSVSLILDSERQTAAAGARSAALRVQLQTLNFDILSADVATTNFLLTGKPDALTPLRKANDAAPAIIGAIEHLCEGDTAQLESIHRISSLSDAAFDRLSDLRQYDPDAKEKPPQSAVAAAQKSVRALINSIAAFQEAENRGSAQTLTSISHSTTVRQQNLTDLGGAVAIGGGILAVIISITAVLKREKRLRASPEPLLQPVAAATFVETASPNTHSPLPPSPVPDPGTITAREVIETAVLEVQEAANAKGMTFRAEIGPAWDYAVGADPHSLQQVIIGIFEAIIGAGAPGAPVTLSCMEQPGRMVRLRFQSASNVLASQLPESLRNRALNLPGSSIRGSGLGVILLEFPCVPSITDLSAPPNAAQSIMGVASRV